MGDNYYITSYCVIRPDVTLLNGAPLPLGDSTGSPQELMLSIYKRLNIDYPKFYKMDNLCKLALITSELVLQANGVTQKYPIENIAIVMSNRSSSLDTDTRFQSSINCADAFFPSPSVFVYTLPNILIGEIAIRNNIKGENAFFVFDQFDATFMAGYVNGLMKAQQAQCCIAGWVDFYEHHFESFIYIVEKQAINGIIEHTAENLEKIFK